MGRLKLQDLTLILFLLLVGPTKAQVTIGSGIEPVKGALLDLKEQDKGDGSANATKGLLLPRVELTDLTKLYPMFTSGYTTEEDAKHTGLTVYNLNKCLTVSPGKGGQGVYIWDGSQWMYLGMPKDISGTKLELLSSLYGTTDADGNLRVDIPSGLDARAISILPFDLTVNSDPLATITDITIGIGLPNGGGVVFSPAQTWTTGALTASPTVYSSLQATDMSSGTSVVTAAVPWKTRQTMLKFSGQAGCPPAATSRSITLNQTNYAILAYNNASPNTIGTASNLILLRDTDGKTFRITGNVGWKAVVTDTKDIMDHTIPATGGADNTVNGWTQRNYTLTGKVTVNTKYETATILLEDNYTRFPKRAKDYTVTVMQCQGIPDMSGVMTADNNTTASGSTAWDDPLQNPTGVVEHAEKSGVYAKFYSAGFGPAGRWMITNLSAWAYDSNISKATLPAAPDASSSNTDPHWCYPNGGVGGSDATSYNADPHLGLFYNWPAATAKGDFQDNKVQGICPNGWHLPSDKEWTALENEIIRNTTSYADVAQNISPDGSIGLLPETESGSRGTHSPAMREICGVNSVNPKGLSNVFKTGGFNVLLAGVAYGGFTSDFGQDAGFWSSSAYSSTVAWRRGLTIKGGSEPSVYRNNPARYFLWSVRCKKDE